MPDALIHIGLPKTGTSAIQSWLRINAAALKSQGVCFEGFGDRLKTPVQHELGFGLMAIGAAGLPVPSAQVRRRTGTQTGASQRQVTEAFAARFRHSLHQCESQTYVISSEWISGWLRERDAIRRFDTEMRRHFGQVTYLVYLRDQIEWVLSSYSQRIRHGGTMTLDAHVQEMAARDYDKICTDWSAGTDAALTVRLMERDFLKDGDLIADFAAHLKVDPTGLASPARSNSALSAGSVRFWQRVNAASAGNLLEKPVRHLRGAWCNSALAGRGRKLALSDSQSRQIALANATTNASLRDKWFPDRPILFQHAHRAMTQTPVAQAATNSQRRNA